jgi:hypothetical protein
VNGAPQAPLAEIRDTAQALLAQGKVDEACEVVLAALDAVLGKNRELELLVLKLRRERIGRRTERLDPRQIGLLFEALLAQGGDQATIDPDAEARKDAVLDREIARPSRPRRAHRGVRGSAARPIPGGGPTGLHARCT